MIVGFNLLNSKSKTVAPPATLADDLVFQKFKVKGVSPLAAQADARYFFVSCDKKVPKKPRLKPPAGVPSKKSKWKSFVSFV